MSQLPEQRNVLLEEFTAINCGNCPAGHAVATAISNANPADVVLVNMHAGPLAAPSGSQPDFRNAWSTQLLGDFAIPATPRGLVNRKPYNGNTVLSSGNWTNASNAVLALPSVVNMAATNTFDNDTRELVVEVELYYTANSPGGSDRIFVLLTEDHLNGPQANYGAGGPYASYDHRHVLRAYITALAGDEVTTTTMGSSVVRTYSYTVPLAYEIEQCRVVAFVGEGATSGYGEVHQVVSAPAFSMSTGLTDVIGAPAMSAYPVPASDRVTITLTPSPVLRELHITDALGRVVKRMSVRSDVQQLEVSVADLAPGMYRYGFLDSTSRGLVVAR